MQSAIKIYACYINFPFVLCYGYSLKFDYIHILKTRRGWGVSIHDVGICIDELLNTDGGVFFMINFAGESF